MDRPPHTPGHRGRAVLLVLGTAAIVAAVVALVIDRCAQEAPTGPSSIPEPSDAPAPAHLAGRAARGTPAPAKESADGDAPFEGPEESSDTVHWSDRTTVTVLADDDGKPVEGATVRMQVSWKPEDFRAGITDAAGRVQLVSPSRGAVVWARAPGFVVYAKDFEDRSGPAEEALEVRLTRGRPLSGRVLLATDGHPVAGADVYVWNAVTEEEVECAPENYGTLRGGLLSDREGRFAVAGVPPGVPLTIAARAAGHGLAVLHLAASDTTSDVVLTLGVGALLEGIVTLDAKGPATGVTVFAVEAGDSFRLGSPDARFLVSGHMHLAALAVTDGAGRYRIEGLPVPGRYVAVAVGEEYAQGAGAVASLTERGDRVVRDVALVTPAWLRVRCFAPDGSPAPVDDCDLATPAGARVEDPIFLGGGSYTQGSNEYSMGTRPPGHWLLLVRGAGSWLPARIPIVLLPGEHKTVEVKFEPGFSIVGVVVDASARPIRGAHVVSGERTTHRSASTDAKGQFRLDGLPAGDLTIEVEGPDGYREPTVVKTKSPSTEVLRIVLPPRPDVVGRFEVPPGFSKEVTGRIRWAEWERTVWPDIDADGSFRLPHVPNGVPFDLTLWCRDGGAPRVLHGLRADVGTRLDLGVVRFSLGRSVDGLVVDENGSPLASALVEPDETVRATDCRTDPAGRFHLTAAPDAAFSIVVKAPGRATVFATVEKDGSPTIRCPMGTLVRGRLTGARDDALVDRRLRFVPRADSGSGGAGRLFEARTDSMGGFEIRVPAGSYEVFTVAWGSEVRGDRAQSTVDRLDQRVGHIDVDVSADAQATLRLPD